ncbi:MAG: 2-keto-4-pentenoate hydratase [Gammaproteobacteria bacterium]|nr:2-keto-4-pentenoate hydratase [Gammaproteobacteria bacterium]
MKFASLYDPKNLDGKLCLVNRDLTACFLLDKLAPSLQYAIEHWDELEPTFQSLYTQLNLAELDGTFPYEPEQLASPLPRAYQWLDGSSYLNHVELVRKARGAEMPKEFLSDPLMYQGVSDGFLRPTEDIPLIDECMGLDFEAEIAVITKKIPMGSVAHDCKDKIILLMLVNDVTLRELIPQELSKGFGFLQSKPASSFSPLAITPDEFQNNWDGERLHGRLLCYLNREPFGKTDTGVGMHFSFTELLAHAARTRELCAGTILGSGTISNPNKVHGSSCIVERRMLEIIANGKASTPYMKTNDVIEIEMLDAQGKSYFGKIKQKVSLYHG